MFEVLKGKNVLIVEDSLMVVLDLISELEETEAGVLGPVSSTEDGLDLVIRQRPDAAILDVNLIDGQVTPLAEVLLENAVPLIFCTAVALPEELANRWPDLVVYGKPATSRQLIAGLAARMTGPAAAERFGRMAR